MSTTKAKINPRDLPKFDVADYLDTPEDCADFLTIAMEDGDAEHFRDALNAVARSKSVRGIAEQAGLNRESLYRALGEKGNPEFGTVMKVMRALGMNLAAVPAQSQECANT